MSISVSVPLRRPLALAIALCLATGVDAVTVTVNSSDDASASAFCNLRNAIKAINNGNSATVPACAGSIAGPFGDNDTIVFGPGLANSTITLAQGQLVMFAPMTMVGSGQTIDAAGASRAMYTVAALSIRDLTITGGNSSGPGAGLYGYQASISLTDSRVISNRSGTGAGGMAIRYGNATLTNAVVAGNSLSGGSGGAGLIIDGSRATLTNSTVSQNTAACSSGYCGGGLSIANGSTVVIIGSTISGNSAVASSPVADGAGGINAIGSAVSVINSTIAGNAASGNDFIAGALIESQTSAGSYGMTLTNTTVSSNSATTTNAGAAFVAGGALIGIHSSASLTLHNSILSANSASIVGDASAMPDLRIKAGAFGAAFSLLGSSSSGPDSGNGNVFTDTPGLKPLANNGGDTQTMALMIGSPAIDAGSNALAVNAASQPLQTDQTGFSRIRNGVVDIGAFEFPGDNIFGDGFEF
ncbi:MAG: choice-of-anchor Q domain-containing protein [Rudaea sp.]|nr:choice-of-anchor Q domain-containing protein [Rudaea sp.]